MDRTLTINDMWRITHVNGKRLGFLKGLSSKVTLPYSSVVSFTFKRKIICPKQVNDTVTVHFSPQNEPTAVLVGRKRLLPQKDEEGKNVYDITSALKTGQTSISVSFSGGKAESVFLSIKRNYAEEQKN